jgi:hypothetical protein
MGLRNQNISIRSSDKYDKRPAASKTAKKQSKVPSNMIGGSKVELNQSAQPSHEFERNLINLYEGQHL